MNLSFVVAPPLDGVVVIATDTPAFRQLDHSGWLTRAVASLKDGAITFAAPPPPLERLVVVKAGSDWRAVGASIAPHLEGLDGGLVSIIIDGVDAAQLAYGLVLRSHRALSYRTKDKDFTPGPTEVVIAAPDSVAAQAQFDRLNAVAAGVCLARDLVAEPGNILGPRELADHALALRDLGVAVRLLDPLAEGCGLLHAVGQGSTRPPLLTVLEWRGGGDEKPLVLVGKGITFDTGGISIKPAEHMEDMKGDMGGAAAVLGALRAVAGRKAKANVCGVLAIAENMPSGSATRPGDVVRSHKGLFVEIVDTDAEGRLVLADALSWACKNLNPGLLVDAATLTGAVVRVLGHHHAGLYTANDRLARRLAALGLAEGEPVWRLPLTEACDAHLKSDVADLKNCAWGPVPDNDDAARFLQHFVDAPWVHLDIAGMSETAEDLPLCRKGPTGFGVRLFDALAAG